MVNMTKKRKPRILIWDIETTPNMVTCWGLWKQNILPQNILKERSVICIAYKWLGEDEVHLISIGDKKRKFKKDPYDDEHVVREMQKVLEQADVLIHHNGNSFDLKRFKARSIKYRLPPLPQIKMIDTLKTARKHFAFNSNKLDYLGEYLGVGRKIHTTNALWQNIIQGDEVALKAMEDYNIQDVILLEAVYEKLKPYMVTHPNLNLFTDTDVDVCPNCGSTHLQKRGTRTTRISIYQRFQCNDCGAWSSSGTMLGKSTVR